MIKEKFGPDGQVVLEYCCDFCAYCTTHNKACSGITPIMECDACGRHVCSGHRKFHKEPWVDSHKGMYCLECWEIGRKYRDEMISIQNEAWQKENDLRLAWHRAGKENKTRRRIDAMKSEKEIGTTVN